MGVGSIPRGAGLGHYLPACERGRPREGAPAPLSPRCRPGSHHEGTPLSRAASWRIRGRGPREGGGTPRCASHVGPSCSWKPAPTGRTVPHHIRTRENLGGSWPRGPAAWHSRQFPAFVCGQRVPRDNTEDTQGPGWSSVGPICPLLLGTPPPRAFLAQPVCKKSLVPLIRALRWGVPCTPQAPLLETLLRETQGQHRPGGHAAQHKRISALKTPRKPRGSAVISVFYTWPQDHPFPLRVTQGSHRVGRPCPKA